MPSDLKPPCHAVVLLCLICACGARAAELTVGPGPDHDFASIQEAIDAATWTDVIVVADGVYTPQHGISFKSKTLTVRSLNGPDTCVIDCQESEMGLYLFRVEAGATLEGFTVAGIQDQGVALSMYASDPIVRDCIFEDNASGAVECNGGSPVFIDCVFRRNTNPTDGGAVMCRSGSPTFRNCLFEENSSEADGGAICSDNYSEPTIVDCIFIGNSAGDDGGAIGNYRSTRAAIVGCTFIGNVSRDNGGAIFSRQWADPIIMSCFFAGNTARSNGAAIYNRENLAVLANCVFTGNTARDSGGAVFNRETYYNPSLLNCTLVNNTAGLEGGAIYNDAATPELLNCILWGNQDETSSAETDPIVGDLASADHCCIQGWTGLWEGVGNHKQAPRFADADGPDGVAGTEDDDLRLAPDSPCIDAAFDTSLSHPFLVDGLGYPRRAGLAIDMGAYEFAPPESLAGIEPTWPDLREEPIVINEVLSHSPTGQHDWIELHNTTKRRICIGGWFLGDENGRRQYRIAPETYIEPRGYRVFHQASHFDNGSDPGSLVRFALDAEGNDLVRLSSGYGGLLTGYRQQQHLEAANSSVSLGRHFRSDGSIVFVPQSVNTPGQPNADPLVGPVVISEIMYHPKTGLSEYIELYNTSAEPVAMAGWKLGRYIAGYASSGPPLYSFPDDSTVVLPAGGRLVIAWDPDDLGDQYGRPPREVPVVGPYRYTLSNAGQRLALIAPGGTMAVDRVTYDDAGGWPREADGSGESLHRVDLTAYGDDAENWTSGPPTPGQ